MVCGATRRQAQVARARAAVAMQGRGRCVAVSGHLALPCRVPCAVVVARPLHGRGQGDQDADVGGSGVSVAWFALDARFLASFSSFCFFLASSRWRFSYE